MKKPVMDKLICQNGHSIGFRRDESTGDGWYTVRCIQCEGLPVIPFTCPFCKNKGAFMWFNTLDDDKVLIRCTECQKWIDNKAIHISLLKTFPFLILGAGLGLGVGFLISRFGLPTEASLYVGSLVGIIVGFILSSRR